MLFVLAQEVQQTPERVILDFNKLSPVVIVELIVSVLLYTSVMSWIFVRLILKSEIMTPTHLLVSALALLTFVALTAAIVTSSTGLETIAATGVGAIAGAVSQRFINVKDVGGGDLNDRSTVSEEVSEAAPGDVSGMPHHEE